MTESTLALTVSPPVKAATRASLVTAAVTGILAAGAVSIELPILALVFAAISAISAIAVGTMVERKHPQLHLEHGEARMLYEAIQRSIAGVEREVADAPRLATTIAPMVERCRELVFAAGRTAQLSNPIVTYLAGHDAFSIRRELERLHLRCERLEDDIARTAMNRAMAARARQLATYQQLIALDERICARLELVRAALESFGALVVKLRVVDEEQAIADAAEMAQSLDEVGDDLAALETTMDLDLAA